jgi:hypothetical protein
LAQTGARHRRAARQAHHGHAHPERVQAGGVSIVGEGIQNEGSSGAGARLRDFEKNGTKAAIHYLLANPLRNLAEFTLPRWECILLFQQPTQANSQLPSVQISNPHAPPFIGITLIRNARISSPSTRGSP